MIVLKNYSHEGVKINGVINVVFSRLTVTYAMQNLLMQCILPLQNNLLLLALVLLVVLLLPLPLPLLLPLLLLPLCLIGFRLLYQVNLLLSN